MKVPDEFFSAGFVDIATRGSRGRAAPSLADEALRAGEPEK